MKTFLAVYLGSLAGPAMERWNALDEEGRKAQEKAGMDGWRKWGEMHQGVIVDNGAPLGKTKRIDAGGVSDVKNLLTGYVIVKAETHEAAAELFRNHPHFAIFPGDAVEIMECLPMPEA